MKRTPLRRTRFKSKRRKPKVPTSERVAIEERSGGRCEVTIDGERCRRRATQPHHKLRRSQGGSDDRSNLVAVCALCHTYIHANPEWAYGAGYLVRSSHVRVVT